MIIWISSYPKSGNTWLRALISSYFFTNNGEFNFELLDKVQQFPKKKFMLSFADQFPTPLSTPQYWVKAQNKINEKKEINFMKTHNAFCQIDGHAFTNKKNTLASIYIVRDPRSVITSISNHYEKNYKESLEFMTNKKKFIFGNQITKNFDNKDYGDFQFLGTWASHYQSWSKNNIFPIKIVKYEELLKNTYLIFKEIVEFINKVSIIKSKFDREKAKKSVLSTDFYRLKKREKDEGFVESPNSYKENKKLTFFNLGPKNEWNKLLPQEVSKKIEENFKKEMKELNYL